MILKIIKTEEVLGQTMNVYGTFENPLFVAADVAAWIGHSDSNMMCKGLDENEKLLQTILGAGLQERKVLMVTEDGLYEIFMLSRKPIVNLLIFRYLEMSPDLD